MSAAVRMLYGKFIKRFFSNSNFIRFFLPYIMFIYDVVQVLYTYTE